MSQYSIGFDNVLELIRKVDRIKEAYKFDDDVFKQTLIENKIEFTPLHPFGFWLDANMLAECGKEDIVFKREYPMVDAAFKETGVINNYSEK